MGYKGVGGSLAFLPTAKINFFGGDISVKLVLKILKNQAFSFICSRNLENRVSRSSEKMGMMAHGGQVDFVTDAGYIMSSFQIHTKVCKWKSA